MMLVSICSLSFDPIMCFVSAPHFYCFLCVQIVMVHCCWLIFIGRVVHQVLVFNIFLGVDLVDDVALINRSSWREFSSKQECYPNMFRFLSLQPIMVSSLFTKVGIKASLLQFFLQYDQTLRINYATLKKRYTIKITLWVMSSQMSTMHHAYIFLCLEYKDIFMYTLLDFALHLLSKMMYEVKRFHE